MSRTYIDHQISVVREDNPTGMYRMHIIAESGERTHYLNLDDRCVRDIHKALLRLEARREKQEQGHEH